MISVFFATSGAGPRGSKASGGSFALRSRPGEGTRIDVAWACGEGRCGRECRRDPRVSQA
jgi:hypothetical protein